MISTLVEPNVKALETDLAEFVVRGVCFISLLH